MAEDNASASASEVAALRATVDERINGLGGDVSMLETRINQVESEAKTALNQAKLQLHGKGNCKVSWPVVEVFDTAASQQNGPSSQSVQYQVLMIVNGLPAIAMVLLTENPIALAP